MAQQVINNGETGLLVRNKINANFTELYTGPENRIPKYNAGGGYVPSLLFDSGANVGIGTITPAAKLHVAGDIRVGIATSPFVSTTYETVRGTWTTGTNDAGNGTTNDQWFIGYNGSGGYQFTVQRGTGSVGIGTETPQSKLSVQTDGSGLASQMFSVGDAGNVNGKVVDITFLSALDGGYIQAKHRNNSYKPLYLNPDGANVGIGTPNAPTEKLEVWGNGLFIDPSGMTLRISPTAIPIINFSRFTGAANGYHNVAVGQFFNAVTGQYDFEIGVAAVVNGDKYFTNRALVINVSNGRVGIGVDNPSFALHVVNSATPIIGMTNSTNAFSELQIGNSVGELQLGFEGAGGGGRMGGTIAQSPYLGTQGNKAFTFHTSNIMRMIILGNGNVGIGATSPGARLEVNTTAGLLSTFMFTGDANNPRINISGTATKMSLVTSSSLTHADLSLGTSAVADAIVIKGPTGMVGIGTNNPSYPLLVFNPTNSVSGFRTNTGELAVGHNNAGITNGFGAIDQAAFIANGGNYNLEICVGLNRKVTYWPSGRMQFHAIPTSSAGLVAGDVWRNGNVLNIV